MKEYWSRLRSVASGALGRIVPRRAASGATPDALGDAPQADGAGEPLSPADSAETPAPSLVLPPRRGLIPPWLLWAAGSIVGLLVIALITVAVWPAGPSVRVPNLGGLDRKAAQERCKVLGLQLVVTDTYFSERVPAGHVAAQYPKPGTIVTEGTQVGVDISAGSESFPLPDVSGTTFESARGTLRGLGLDVTFITVGSTAAQGTVVSSSPAAGTTVTVGVTIRLSVSAGAGATSTLLPSDLSGRTFVIDPTFAPAALSADVNFDVARRIRALLENAGARVVLTRSLTDTPATASDADRLRRAREATSTALVQLYVATSGSVGLQVQSLPATGTASAVVTASKALATAATTALRSDFPSTTTTAAVGATLIRDFGGTAVRIRLGSSASTTDRASFTDADWEDSVARDIYAALARTYGRD